MSISACSSWRLEAGAKTQNGFTRNWLIQPGEIERFREYFGNRDVYTTVLVYNQTDLAQADKYGPFYMDFDGAQTPEGLQKTCADAQAALAFLRGVWDIPPEYVKIYFSGAKGIHLLIPPQVFGLQPQPKLHLLYRRLAQQVAAQLQHGTLDLAIYDHRRLFRLPNSINGKTGFYKVPLTFAELKAATPARIQELAQGPRKLNCVSVKPVPRAQAAVSRIIELEDTPTGTSRFRRKKHVVFPPCIQELRENGIEQGKRDNAAIALTSFWQQQGLDAGEVFLILKAWNQAKVRPPLAERDITRIVSSCYRGEYTYGCHRLKELVTCPGQENCPFFNHQEASQ